MPVPSIEAQNAFAPHEHMGETYYFSLTILREWFDADPHPYVMTSNNKGFQSCLSQERLVDLGKMVGKFFSKSPKPVYAMPTPASIKPPAMPSRFL